MDRFVIEGPTRLEGELAVGGAKNAVLPLMAAALLARGESVIDNVPDLQDVRFFATILATSLGTVAEERTLSGGVGGSRSSAGEGVDPGL